MLAETNGWDDYAVKAKELYEVFKKSLKLE